MRQVFPSWSELFCVIVLVVLSVLAVYINATLFSDYWSVFTVSSTSVYALIAMCGTALSWIVWRRVGAWQKFMQTMLWYTAPSVLVLWAAILLRSLEYGVLKTRFNEFDLLVNAWMFAVVGFVVWSQRVHFAHAKKRATKRHIFVLSALGFSMAIFVFFGMYKLDKAAYVDERLWTYSGEKRIEKYWDNLIERDWINTRPSDKPGVTLAIVEGPSLLFVTPSDFADDYIADKEGFAHMLYVVRLPLIIIGALALGVFYFLLSRLLAPAVALGSVLFMATSPILIGMARIVNPDALSWIVVPLTLLVYLQCRKTNAFVWVVATGVLFGLGLLTKYIANILLLFFFVVLVGEAFFGRRDAVVRAEEIKNHLRSILLIVLVALVTFTALFPGVWMRADRLLLATIWSEPFVPFWQIFVALSVVLFMDARLFGARMTTWCVRSVARLGRYGVRVVPLVFVVSIVWAVWHVYIAPGTVSFSEILASPKTSANPDGGAVSPFVAFITSVYVLIFGIHPVVYGGLLYAVVRMTITKKWRTHTYRTVWFLLLFILFYYVGSIVSTTIPTVRYQIIVYPLAFVVAATGYVWLVRDVRARGYAKILFGLGTILLLVTLVRTAPHYFSYNSEILPLGTIINPKDMGDGSYEAAVWLNALPGAEHMNIWSDKNGVCTYFVGTCSGNIRKKDFIAYGPHYDYFVISRGRESRTRELAAAYSQGRADYPINFEALYADDAVPVHEITLASRASNYIRIFDENDVHVWREADFPEDFSASIPLPHFPDVTCRMDEYGAIPGDGVANKAALNAAITACAHAGGGMVVVPRGIWDVAGSIVLQSNINLHLDVGAVLSFSPHPDDYLPMVRTRFIGLEAYNYAPAIYAQDVTNVAITGTGVIDGNGAQWPDFIDRQKDAIKRLYKMSLDDVPVKERRFGTHTDALRPSLIQFFDAQNVLVDGVTIKQGPMWTLHPVYVNGLTVRNVTIIADGSNTDGIVIDSSRNVYIADSTIRSGDDAIALKSGRDHDGIRVHRPTRDVYIENITVTHAHTGIAIGSEMSGGVQYVFVRDMRISDANRGIRIKTTPGRGGTMSNITFKDIEIDETREAESIQVTMDYGSSSVRPKTNILPAVENLHFENIHTYTTHPYKPSILVEGIDERTHLKNVTFKDIVMRGKATVKILHADDVRFVQTDARHFEIADSKEITIEQDFCPGITTEDVMDDISLRCNS